MKWLRTFLYSLRWVNAVTVIVIGGIFARQGQLWYASTVVVIGLIQDAGLTIADTWLEGRP